MIIQAKHNYGILTFSDMIGFANRENSRIELSLRPNDIQRVPPNVFLSDKFKKLLKEHVLEIISLDTQDYDYITKTELEEIVGNVNQYEVVMQTDNKWGIDKKQGYASFNWDNPSPVATYTDVTITDDPEGFGRITFSSSHDPNLTLMVDEWWNYNWTFIYNGGFYICYLYKDIFNPDYVYVIQYNLSPLPEISVGEDITILVYDGQHGFPNYHWFDDSSNDFRGANINYHAYVNSVNGGGTFIGNILIARDSFGHNIKNNFTFSGSHNFEKSIDIGYRPGFEKRISVIYYWSGHIDFNIHYTYEAYYSIDHKNA